MQFYLKIQLAYLQLLLHFKVVAFPSAVTWDIVTYVNTIASLSWNTVISANSYDIYRIFK